MAQLRRDFERFSERGFAVAAIALGTPTRAAAFKAEHDIPFTLIGDKEKAAYARFGLGSAPITQLISPSVMSASFRALRAGHVPSLKQDDGAQLPGTFIIDPGGIVRFAKAATHPGDLASTSELLTWIDNQVPSHQPSLATAL